MAGREGDNQMDGDTLHHMRNGLPADSKRDIRFAVETHVSCLRITTNSSLLNTRIH